MNRRGVVLSILLCNCFIACAAGQEAESSWWNPFGGGSSDDSMVRESSFFNEPRKNDSTSSMFKLPKLGWPSFGTSSSKKKSSPSTLSKMGNSTKRMWSSSIDFLNPFDSPPAKTQQGYLPREQGYRPQNIEESSGSGMFGWMWREEKTETPATINDWLSQPNPLLTK